MTEGETPPPIFEEAELVKMLKNDEFDFREFLMPRQNYLRANMNTYRRWPFYPVYHNVQMVLNHLEQFNAGPGNIKLQDVKDLLEKIAKLDNHTTSIYTAINDIFMIMHLQQQSLEKKLVGLRKQPARNENIILELKKTYEASWRSLRTDLKAQRDVLAIEEDLRDAFMKELKAAWERGGGGGSDSWWKPNSPH
ncbi:hypothetical protein ABW20_dc0106501 [Dactylellina cionopaga]|nr:hypothetical protein ABW20_dc0106501 [Dactylellina cionopaga]